MALDKASLKSALKTLMSKEEPTSVDDAVDALADAIETYVKSGSVKITVPNLTVSTTGTAAAQTGTATGVVISDGTIS